MSSNVILEAPQYGSLFLEKLKVLYDKGQLCDFTLTTENGEVRLHSTVLFTASQFFRSLLTSGKIHQQRYSLKEANGECLQVLVHFMYTGRLYLSYESVWIVQALAEQLDIPEAICLCQTFLSVSHWDLLAPETSVNKTENDFSQTLPQEEKKVDNTTTQAPQQGAEEEKSLPFVQKAYKTRQEKRKTSYNEQSSDHSWEESDADSPEDDVEPFPVKKKRGRTKGSKNKPKNSNLPAAKFRNKKHLPICPFKNVLTLRSKPNKTWTCEKCRQSFSWKSMLVFHRRVHFDHCRSKVESQYLSKSAVSYMFASSWSYWDPVRLQYNCTVCAKSFRLKTLAKLHFSLKHVTTHKLFHGKKCSMKHCLTHQKLHFLHNYHTANYQTYQNQYFDCPKCSRKFMHRQSLRKHKLSAHGLGSKAGVGRPPMSKRKTWICEEEKCLHVFPNKKHLEVHMKEKHPSVKYSCQQCGYQVRAKILLQKHWDMHHDSSRQLSSSASCHICGKVFGRSYFMKVHLFTKHNIHDPTLPLFRCPAEGCKYACVKKDMLERHSVKHTEEKPFVCEICGKHLKTKLSLQSHTSRIHLGIRDFICDVCGQAYGNEAILKTHMKCHSETYTFRCEHCEYGSSNRENFKTHLFGRHGVKMREDMKIRECPICDFSCVSNYRFTDHMRVHNHVRDQACPQCGKKFMTRAALGSHVKRVHNPKDFKCGSCTYITSERSKLTEHVRIMHTHRNFKPYKCPYCSFQSATGRNCRQHVKQKHKDKEVHYIKLSPEEATVDTPCPVSRKRSNNNSSSNGNNKSQHYDPTPHKQMHNQLPPPLPPPPPPQPVPPPAPPQPQPQPPPAHPPPPPATTPLNMMAPGQPSAHMLQSGYNHPMDDSLGMIPHSSHM